MSRIAKVLATIVLVGIYRTIAATLILHDNESAALGVRTYLNSGRAEWLLRWVYFLAGSVVAYLSLKLSSLLKGYMKSRRAENLAIRERFRETQKAGWIIGLKVRSHQSAYNILWGV